MRSSGLTKATPLAFAMCLLGANLASAAASDWYEHEGGNLRIVTTGRPDAGGVLRGVLQIELQPGWHTYWRDPGETGVAPSVNVAPSSAPVEIGFPAPSRLADGSAGYDAPVSLPLTIRPDPAARGKPLVASVFLGVCNEICIPVEATLKLDPLDGADDPIDAATVAQSFAALPEAPSSAFGVTGRVSKQLEITAEALLPDGLRGAELFAAGEGGYALGAPQTLSEANGKAVFRIAVLNKPAGETPEAAFPYVLKAGGRAVAGTMRISGF